MPWGSRKARVDEHRAGDPEAVRTAALVLLARREYSSTELSAALLRKGYERGAVSTAVAELGGERLVDDDRYAAALVRQLAARGQGPARIRQQLQQSGIGAARIAAAMDSGPDWHAIAAETRIRKFGAAVPRDWPTRARQMRFLQYRGFSNDHIGNCLGRDPGVPDSDP